MPNGKRPDLPPQQSPKLKMAADEIKKILERYDIAGVAQLFTPGFTEYTIHLRPSFSCVEINKKGQLRINPPILDPQNPTPAKKKISDSVNMVANFRIHLGKLFQVFTQADIAVRTQFGMMPKPGDPPPFNGLKATD